VYYKGGMSGDYSMTRHNDYKTGKAFHIDLPVVMEKKTTLST
jgi:hypothetical protein